MPGHPAIKARPPWPEGTSREQDRGVDCPRQTAVFRCERAGCPHTPLSRSYAEGAAVPWAVDCRCGRVARRYGAPPGSMPETLKYGQVVGGRAKDPDALGISPVAQLWKRRTRAEAEELLAERMAQVRGSGVAR